MLAKRGIFYPKLKDQFYIFQQQKIRGSYEDIRVRQKTYLKYIDKVPKNILQQYPFLECGFGRGEFLGLLREHGLKNVAGVDTNKKYVQTAQKQRFTVIHDDAVKYIYLYNGYFSGVSAFHLIEHLTFPQLFDFLFLCSKKLAKGGILLLETPNIENLVVSSTSFYYDHTHILKISRLFLENLLEFLEFSKIQFLFLHEARPKILNDVESLLFGPQDLGVVAYK